MPDEVSIGIPWKIIAASPDMMDVTYNNRRFPYAWRSSLAISIFEPPTAELPSTLCGQKIAFVKVTCSLTGYQRSGDETSITFDNEPLEELSRLTTEYLGCYGALLNVAFFPPPPQVVVAEDVPDLTKFPYILDFSPKSRELIRGITESGEMLTGSSRNIGVDRSLTTTNKNETTVGVEASVEAGIGGGGGSEGASGSAAVGAKASAKLEHTWGTTTEDKRGLNVGSGTTQERRESYATQLDQLYSLLTGYHSGTNRATFIMLARPGTLQPTNRRTFAPGLRMLEGVQDFVFVVSRPIDQDSLCIEASLNTGHFPEEVQLVGEQGPERRTLTYTFNYIARGGINEREGGEQIDFGDRPEDARYLPSDENGQWVLDTDVPGTRYPGIILVADRTRTDPPVGDGIVADEYKPIDLVPIGAEGITFQFRGRVDARGGNVGRGHINTIVDVEYRVHAKRHRKVGVEQYADVNQMLVTTRGLNVCYRSLEGCPQVFEPARLQLPDDLKRQTDWLDDFVRPRFTLNMPYEQLYTKMRSTLVAGAAAATKGIARRSFIETDYFSRKVATTIPPAITTIQLAQAINLHEHCQAESMLNRLNIGQFLTAESRTLVRKANLAESVILQLRRDVLQYIESCLQE